MASLPWPWLKGKRASRVEMLRIMKSKRAPIAQFRAPADVHDMAGHKACLFREQIHAGIGNGIAFRAVTERMNFIEITLDRSRVGLLGAPFAEHWRPRAGRANGVYADAVLRSEERRVG